MKDKQTKLDRAIVNKMYIDIKQQRIQILTDEEFEHYTKRRKEILKLLSIKFKK